MVDHEKKGPDLMHMTHFAVTLVNQKTEGKVYFRDANHRFNKHDSDWGFTQYMKLSQVRDPNEGWVGEDGSLILRVEIQGFRDTVRSDRIFYSYDYDSRKATGFVGLQNQGATCYMNSLLQTLYNTAEFRKAVYHMPTDTDETNNSIPLALQRLFYNLQHSPNAVETKELTKSFGWDAYDSFTQHDVQELNRVLCDNLEGKMKGTVVEGTVEKMFQGTLRNYISCLNVDYTSTRDEAFYDVSLNVKGCDNIYDSFDQYIEAETMDGENQYRAEGHGLQDAKRGCAFLKFPPVLMIHLKRFEYDFEHDAMIKVNDKYAFPPMIELDKYLHEDADKSVPQTYELHGVLVHSGDVHGGHYYAFLRPTADNQWFKFDDERVTVATSKQAIQDNYGGSEDVSYTLGSKTVKTSSKRHTNGYMLVYVRMADMHHVLEPAKEEDVPPELHERFLREQDEIDKKRQEKADAHKYCQIKIAREQDLKEHSGFDLFDHKKAETSVKILKTATVAEAKAQLAEQIEVPAHRQRWWHWVGRQNKTTRPDVPVSAAEEKKMIMEVWKYQSEVKVFVEVADEDVPEPAEGEESTVFAPYKASTDALMSFKFYNPEDRSLKYVGSKICSVNDSLVTISNDLCAMAGLPEGTELMAYEEIKPSMIEPVTADRSFKDAEIGGGDVITFQAATTSEEPFAKAIEHYEYIQHRVDVRFRELSNPKEDAYVMEMSRKMLYDEVSATLAEKLEVPPLHLRFTSHNTFYDQPKTHKIKRNEKLKLSDMLYGAYQPATDVLYFEKLECPITELENKKNVKVTWYDANVKEGKEHSLLLEKDAKIEQLLEKVKENVELSENGSGKLRLLEVWHSKITKIMQPSDPIYLINDYASWRVEEIPKEEDEMTEDDLLVRVQHVQKDHPLLRLFGDPFFMVLRKGETIAEVKKRIQDKLALTDEEFEGYKIALCSFLRIDHYLEDDAVMADHKFLANEYIGLEHKDTSTKSSTKRTHHSMFKEKAIVIKN
eukprot:TRINITY_DN2224_c0_g1_i30.p1 TRINITY_DN2224_c0_g1~~TRINITY_DN2224_c0_g1_i30.p1  ORF type:complete len:1001 (-),score=396.75 TRINITY_DN2224_c0_g1_i30:177-3179(-)